MFFYILGIILIALDQITKSFVIGKLSLRQSIPIIDGILHFTYVRNTGIAFSLFPRMNIVIIILSTITVLLLFHIYRKTSPDNLLTKTSLIFIASGAIGNLIDRMQYSAVIDFIDFRIWPIFNLADAFIVIGVAVIIIDQLRRKDASDTLSVGAN